MVLLGSNGLNDPFYWQISVFWLIWGFWIADMTVFLHDCCFLKQSLSALVNSVIMNYFLEIDVILLKSYFKSHFSSSNIQKTPSCIHIYSAYGSFGAAFCIQFWTKLNHESVLKADTGPDDPLFGRHSLLLLRLDRTRWEGVPWVSILWCSWSKNQRWQPETSMASSASCGQLNERESSREAVWGVCWWADNVTWCDCCQTFIARLVNHSELPLAKSPVGCQEPKPSRKPPRYSSSLFNVLP